MTLNWESFSPTTGARADQLAFRGTERWQSFRRIGATTPWELASTGRYIACTGGCRLGFGIRASYTMGLLNLSTGVVALVLRRRDDVRAEAAPLVFVFLCADRAPCHHCSWLEVCICVEHAEHCKHA